MINLKRSWYRYNCSGNILTRSPSSKPIIRVQGPHLVAVAMWSFNVVLNRIQCRELRSNGELHSKVRFNTGRILINLLTGIRADLKKANAPKLQPNKSFLWQSRVSSTMWKIRASIFEDLSIICRKGLSENANTKHYSSIFHL